MSPRTLERLFAVFLTLVIPLFSTSLFAQTYRGTILGTVSDANGGVISGAKVTVTNTATGLERNTVTLEDGSYTVPELPIGTYEVRVEQTGFQNAKVEKVSVAIAAQQRVDVTLQVSAQSDVVVVSGIVPLVNTTSTVLGNVLENKQIADLPVNGRDYQKLLVVSPGTTGDPSGAADSPGSFGLFSANGNRGRANNYLLDGTDMNDGYRNLPAINQGGVFGVPATILPVEAIQELVVLSNFAPEYGRNSGAIVNIVTKSGTNEFHGTAFEHLRNNYFDARNFFNTKPNQQTALRNNQFGFSLGGPIYKNRTFFFVNYEGQRERVGLNSLARVPDPAELAALGGPKNDIIRQLLARNPWPSPNISVPLFDPSPNVSLTTPAKADSDNFIAKVDHSITANDTISGRYYFGDSNQSFPLAIIGGNVLPGYNTVTPTRVQIVSLSYLKVISNTKVNELRYGYNRYNQGFFAEDRDFDPRSIGLNTGALNPRDFGSPFIRIRNDDRLGSAIAPLGATLSVPRGRIATNNQLLDNFSWKFSKHDLKFGYEFRRTFVNGFFDAGYRGRIDFASLKDFLAGTPSGGRSAFGDSQRGTFQNSHSAYVQDSYRFRPRITLNYGVRYDYFGLLGEERGRLSNFDPKKGLVAGGRLYDRDANNFSPRLGVAWDVTGKGRTVVRAGWGVFNDIFSQDFFVGQLPFNTFNPGPAYNPIGESPILFSFSATDKLTAGAPVFSGFGDSDVFGVDRNLRTPYVQNYNLNLQHQFFTNTVLQVGYVGSTGRKLYRYRDINQPGNPAVNTGRPFDNGPFAPSGGTFFYVNQFESTAVSQYHSLQSNLSVRDFHGLTTSLNYTWSHSIDNASDGQDFVPNATQPDNSYRPDLEKGNSNFDSRHRFVMTFVYALPKFNVTGPVTRRLANGWQVSGLLTVRSGNPFHVNFFDDFNGTGEFFVRPELVGDPYAGTSAPDRFLNLSAFKVPCGLDADGACIPGTYQFGSLGRNSLKGPNYKNFDFSITKLTDITEKVKFEFRAEFYNLFNHPNFSNPLLPSFLADAGFNGIDASGRGIGFLPLTATPDVGIGNPFLGGGGNRNIQFVARILF
ncbi:MAG: carboxypeptidase regulatory-like domain-containing protein [Blastocatellia bacterium]|nr:carboxypeptidase regulatory-like domain-containing protein [Blastocatellia bacterium]